VKHTITMKRRRYVWPYDSCGNRHEVCIYNIYFILIGC